MVFKKWDEETKREGTEREKILLCVWNRVFQTASHEIILLSFDQGFKN